MKKVLFCYSLPIISILGIVYFGNGNEYVDLWHESVFVLLIPCEFCLGFVFHIEHHFSKKDTLC
jgi:hypothetical protein